MAIVTPVFGTEVTKVVTSSCHDGTTNIVHPRVTEQKCSGLIEDKTHLCHLSPVTCHLSLLSLFHLPFTLSLPGRKRVSATCWNGTCIRTNFGTKLTLKKLAGYGLRPAVSVLAAQKGRAARKKKAACGPRSTPRHFSAAAIPSLKSVTNSSETFS